MDSRTMIYVQQTNQLPQSTGRPVGLLAYGSCSSSFHDLFDGATDLTGLVLALASSDASAAASTDTAGESLAIIMSRAFLILFPGLGGEAYGRFSYFDLATTPLEAVLCSTNVTSERSQAPALSLKCEDTLAEHEAFKATLNTNFLVECPAGCGDIESLQVFGSEGIYAERSSICKAAVHAGLIHFGGTFTVATESPSLSFEGSVQNGVKSKSLHLSAGEVVRSVRLFRIREVCDNATASSMHTRLTPCGDQECPGDALGHSVAPSQSPLASFLAIESRLLASPNHAHQAYDPALAEACEALKERIRRKNGRRENGRRGAKKNQTGGAIERERHRQGIRIVSVYKQATLPTPNFQSQCRLRDTELLTNRLLATSAGVTTRLEYLQEELKQLEETHVTQQGYKSYQLNPQETTFKREFVVEDSAYTRAGPSHWGFASLVSGHKNVVGQSTAIRGLAELHGTYALLSRLNVYDFTLHVEFLDTNNGYLLLMHQKVGKKSLIRIEKGISKTLAQKEDGGFIQGVWHKVRIQALRGHVKVCIGEENEQDAEIFSVLDERFVAGTVGLFSSGMEDGVYFDKLKIEAHPCAIAKRELAPLPPHCSVFADTYFSSVGALYMIIDGDDKGGEAGHWEYRQASEPLALPLLSPDVEIVNNRLRLRSTVTKKSSILGRTDMQRSLSGWHTLQVAFDGSRVAIRLQHPHSTAPTQLVVNFQPQQKTPSDGSVGLAAFNCGGVAFDTIQLSPFHAEAATEPSEMLHNKTAARQLACGREYCTECCAYHTSLLSTQQKMRCEKGCLRNTDAARKIEADFTNKVQQCAGGHDKRAALCSAVSHSSRVYRHTRFMLIIIFRDRRSASHKHVNFAALTTPRRMARGRVWRRTIAPATALRESALQEISGQANYEITAINSNNNNHVTRIFNLHASLEASRAEGPRPREDRLGRLRRVQEASRLEDSLTISAAITRNTFWLYEQKHNKKAVKQADAILKKFPDHGETLSMKGLILSNMGSDKKQEAYDYAKRGLRADITNCVCWHVLGLLYRQDKDYAEASKCFVQTLRLDPNNYQAMKDLANLQIHERNLQGFLETRRHILKARSRFIREWAAFAMANHLVGRLTVAQDILGEMENQFGESRDLDAFEKSEIMLYKATLLEEMGEYRKCYDYVSQREQSILDETALIEMQARMAIFLQEFELGRVAYTRLVEMNKDNECYLLGLMACAEDARIRSLFALPCCSLNGAIGRADSMDYLKTLKHLNEGRIFRSNSEASVYLMPRSLRSSGEDAGGWLESLFTRQAESEAYIQDPELTPILGWKKSQKTKALPVFKVLRRGVVSLFSALRRLYTRNRVQIIGH
ncbi:hypothetical protein ACSSS7_004098 [Eimeria intestinalis]